MIDLIGYPQLWATQGKEAKSDIVAFDFEMKGIYFSHISKPEFLYI